MENVTEEKTALQWHPAFYAGLQIELTEEAHLLEFENEHQLGTKPKEIDVLVIKKDEETVIRKNIGRIFRRHNIIEYKSPGDYLSIDDFYKVFGYACFYKADVPKVDQIKAKEITITYVCKKYPRKVLEHLEKEMGLKVELIENGIYYVYGMCFLVQVIVTSRLSQKENLWLASLTDDLKNKEWTERLLKDYRQHKNEEFYESMMDIIIDANESVFKEGKQMSGSLMRIIKDTVDQQVEERLAVYEENAKTLAKTETFLSLVQDGLLSASEAAKRLSITEEEFLAKMNA